MDPASDTVVRLLVTGILLLALAAKLRDFGDFRAAVQGYEVLPASLAGVASASVVLWEAASAAALWAWPGAGGLLAASLFLTYAAAIAVNLKRGRSHMDCGCEWGGAEPMAAASRLSLWLPLRNGLLAALSLALAVPGAARALSLEEYALFGVAAAFFLVTFVAMDRAVRQSLAMASSPAAGSRAGV